MVGNIWYESEDARRIKYDKAMPDSIFEAAKHSINNRAEISDSDTCGCYYCLFTFKPEDINEWINTEADEFPMCPECGIDAVIGDKSGYDVTSKLFLKKMNDYWFDGDASSI